MKSYMQKDKECYLCRRFFGICNDAGLHKHHIYEGNANRRISERMGAWIWLCGRHHNLSGFGIHFNKDIDLEVKRTAQRMYERDHTRDDFVELIGKNYLEE